MHQQSISGRADARQRAMTRAPSLTTAEADGGATMARREVDQAAAAAHVGARERGLIARSVATISVTTLRRAVHAVPQQLGIGQVGERRLHSSVTDSG